MTDLIETILDRSAAAVPSPEDTAMTPDEARSALRGGAIAANDRGWYWVASVLQEMLRAYPDGTDMPPTSEAAPPTEVAAPSPSPVAFKLPHLDEDQEASMCGLTGR